MNPEERKAKNRVWRALYTMVERWEDAGCAMSPAGCARELREFLSIDPPRPPGRPKGR